MFEKVELERRVKSLEKQLQSFQEEQKELEAENTELNTSNEGFTAQMAGLEKDVLRLKLEAAEQANLEERMHIAEFETAFSWLRQGYG